MKGTIFLLSFCCIFVVTDAMRSNYIDCYVNKKGETPSLTQFCLACGYHESSPNCTKGVVGTERFCLTGDTMEYQDDSENKTFSVVDQCSLEGKGCQHFVFICKSDRCNMDCGPMKQTFAQLSSTSSSPSTTTQQPSSTVPPSTFRLTSSIPSTTTSATTTTEVQNGGISATVSFYLFGFFALIFSFML
uniref:Uncharacterized protein n=1 Tax=Panagrolaimus superbus TaxID=310955 RepID=A0A914Y1M5_9BILA